jgi:hypothetical protein
MSVKIQRIVLRNSTRTSIKVSFEPWADVIELAPGNKLEVAGTGGASGGAYTLTRSEHGVTLTDWDGARTTVRMDGAEVIKPFQGAPESLWPSKLTNSRDVFEMLSDSEFRDVASLTQSAYLAPKTTEVHRLVAIIDVESNDFEIRLEKSSGRAKLEQDYYYVVALDSSALDDALRVEIEPRAFAILQPPDSRIALWRSTPGPERTVLTRLMQYTTNRGP